MSNIIEQLEAEQLEGREIPEFSPGDTIEVKVKVIEGERERLQAFEANRSSTTWVSSVTRSR